MKSGFEKVEWLWYREASFSVCGVTVMSALSLAFFFRFFVVVPLCVLFFLVVFSVLEVSGECLRMLDPSVVPRTRLHPDDDIAGRARAVIATRGLFSPLLTFAVADVGLNAGLGSVAQAVGSQFAVGAFLYGEATAESSQTTVWGANAIATTMSQSSNAVGLEINALDLSAHAGPVTYGLHVVNGGVRNTTAAVVIETSESMPLGMPQYGLWLKENTAGRPAAVGIRIDRIGGVAIQIAEGDCLMIGTVCLTSSGGKLRVIEGGSQ